MKKVGFYLLSFAAGFVLLTLFAAFFAWNPSELLVVQEEAPAPVKVKIAEPPVQEEVVEPPPAQKQASLLSTLAPDSFSGPQDIGSGVAFGSGGFGPAVGGGGGFGSDAASLAQERGSINRPPRLLLKGPLEYPSEARQKSISGFVVLKILVGSAGGVESMEVEESEPKGFFDQAAIKSVKSWKFEPALVKGQIVAAWTSQRIKFELN